MAAFLLSAQGQVGTGSIPAGKNATKNAFVLVENGSNTAGVSLLVSPNGADHWLALTGWSLTPGVTATAQILDMYLPFVNFRVDWHSGGAPNVNAIYDGMGVG